MYPQVFGKYVLERELSRGGMARVVLATLRGAGGFEKRLVVKQIRDELAYDQQFVRRFVEEAKTTVALSHPNIVPVYELGVEQGTYFLAMELVEGVSVADLLRERNPDGSRRVLTPEEGAYIGTEVCRALDYAHRRMKVVHRDITPRNVMIDEEGQVKLIDFGIAAPALVAGHEILGSPGHMPPEQVDGLELGPPTDIFAVAVLLVEAWTGSAPFRRATPEECFQAMREPPPRVGAFDPRLGPLDEEIARALRTNPRARQQEASDLGRALRGFIQGRDVEDIARALGERVRLLREEAEAPVASVRALAPRPSAASHGELGTKTFAARDETLGWSPTSPEVEEEGPVPSTRRIEEGALPPAVRQALATKTPQAMTTKTPPAMTTPTPAISTGAVAARRVDPALSIPTPLMVDVDQLERIHAEIAQVAPDAPVRQMDVPTVRRPKMKKPLAESAALMPIETPAREIAIRPASRGPVYGAIAAAFVALAALVVWRTRPPTEPPRPLTTSTAVELGGTATATATVPRPPAPSVLAAPSGSASAAAATDAPGLVVSARPPPSAPVVASARQATVQLLGEPGTRVLVDGVLRGACPARVALEAGAHDVRFLFDPTGESRGERLVVKAGEQVTVRAEFTGATPTIKIAR